MAFIFDAEAGETPETIARQREIAAMLLGQGPVASPNTVGGGIGNALASLAGGFAAGSLNRGADAAQTAGREGANSLFQQLVGGISNGTPITGAPPSPGAQPTSAPAQGGDMSAYQNAIASIESKGSGDYGAIGATHPKLGRALGKYQVMEANVGPWSQAALGRAVSPEEFLANPQIQDAVFNSQFGQYVKQFGPQGAAQAWFAGPGGIGTNRQDSLGTSVPEYTAKFNAALGGGDQAQMPPGSQPTQGVAPQPSGAPQMQGGASMQQIMQVLSNPWSTPQQRSVAEMLLKQQMEAQDPMRQLQMEKGRLEIDALRNPQPKPTDDIREYEFARQQGYQGTFTDFQTEMRRAGATSVNVGGAEKGFDKTVGEGYGKRFLGMQEEAQGAQRALNALNIMEQSLNDPNFYSGFGAERTLQLKRIGAAMGLDPKGITSMETFNSMTKQAALDTMGGSLGTGFSNADRDFVIDQVPNAGNTPEGNRRLVEIQRKLNQRKQEIAQIARGYAAEHNGRIDAGFDDYLSKWAEANPLFQAAGGQSTSGNNLKSKYGLE